MCIDRDPSAIEEARRNLSEFAERVDFVRSDFRYLDEILTKQGLCGVDGILFDFGVSSPQLDEPERGFSYLKDAPLDMRMDPSISTTAADLVNGSSESELRRIISEYGEERWASRIAKFIVRERERRRIDSTLALVEIIKAAIPAGARRKGPHPAKRTFQALRIAVNDELGAITRGLDAAIRWLVPGGTVCAISFHSLEDRVVKQVFRHAATGGEITILTRKPVVPSAGEIEQNPRARSAKLRAARKVLKAGEVE